MRILIGISIVSEVRAQIGASAAHILAGIQDAGDCNQNGVLDAVEIEGGTMFATDLAGLIGSYYGFAGLSHSSSYTFDQEFLFIRRAWLRVSGIADSGWSSSLSFYVTVDNVPTPGATLEYLDDYEICIPASFSSDNVDGVGFVHLGIVVNECCDHTSYVSHAALIFEGVARPAGQDLTNFAQLQNCLGASTNIDCGSSDIDRDGVVDLADLAWFVQVLDGP